MKGFQVTLARGRTLLSPLVRKAFSDAAAQDCPGDRPAAVKPRLERDPLADAPSDCWPMEVISGGVHFHNRVHDSHETVLSAGKLSTVTGAAA